ncbi:hypothetical protein MPNT_170037 [Candidatus Methylacidithermus pantelleriae]|uniref:Uncharacterized protein n=1 Tax=Candidatus Methylacidithermus pantelleriae TaxID=2744239 RepID=A0A8J2BLZ1_9BACT|nr:hypothetical protein MPNT_170037 [Candidatus Methylacidithermus pantelleriae]
MFWFVDETPAHRLYVDGLKYHIMIFSFFRHCTFGLRRKQFGPKCSVTRVTVYEFVGMGQNGFRGRSWGFWVPNVRLHSRRFVSIILRVFGVCLEVLKGIGHCFAFSMGHLFRRVIRRCGFCMNFREAVLLLGDDQLCLDHGYRRPQCRGVND